MYASGSIAQSEKTQTRTVWINGNRFKDKIVVGVKNQSSDGIVVNNFPAGLIQTASGFIESQLSKKYGIFVQGSGFKGIASAECCTAAALIEPTYDPFSAIITAQRNFTTCTDIGSRSFCCGQLWQTRYIDVGFDLIVQSPGIGKTIGVAQVYFNDIAPKRSIERWNKITGQFTRSYFSCPTVLEQYSALAIAADDDVHTTQGIRSTVFKTYFNISLAITAVYAWFGLHMDHIVGSSDGWSRLKSLADQPVVSSAKIDKATAVIIVFASWAQVFG